MTDGPLVGVMMGSHSDWDTIKNTASTLESLGISWEARVLSAHRTPDETAEYAAEAQGRGIKVIIAAAGGAAALPGAILRVLLDDEHWLASGTDGEIGVLVEGSRVFRPVTLDDGTNVGRYADEDDLLLGGIVWEESRPQLANKAFLIHQPVGSGQIVAFAEDPNYRAYAEATQLLFMNAVLLGPGR